MVESQKITSLTTKLDLRSLLSTRLQKLHLSVDESSPTKGQQSSYNEDSNQKTCSSLDGKLHSFKVYKPRYDFSIFDRDDVYKWLYKCNHYFEIKEVDDCEKLKLASYYIDRMNFYWNRNFMESMGNQEVSSVKYIEALCSRFRGQQDPLEEFKYLKLVFSMHTFKTLTSFEIKQK